MQSDVFHFELLENDKKNSIVCTRNDADTTINVLHSIPNDELTSTSTGRPRLWRYAGWQVVEGAAGAAQTRRVRQCHVHLLCGLHGCGRLVAAGRSAGTYVRYIRPDHHTSPPSFKPPRLSSANHPSERLRVSKRHEPADLESPVMSMLALHGHAPRSVARAVPLQVCMCAGGKKTHARSASP